LNKIIQASAIIGLWAIYGLYTIFIYLLTTSVSGRVPVVLPVGYPGNKLPGYGSPKNYKVSFCAESFLS